MNVNDDLKKTSEEITLRLKDTTLTADERAKLEAMRSAVSGALLSTWLPHGNGRRLIMAVIAASGAYGFFAETSILNIWWLLPFFSPRIVGEAAYLMGRLSR